MALDYNMMCVACLGWLATGKLLSLKETKLFLCTLLTGGDRRFVAPLLLRFNVFLLTQGL